MKAIILLTVLKAWATSLPVVLFALAVAAQPTPHPARRPLPGPDSPRGEQTQFPRSRPGFGPEAVLNEQQRIEWREILNANHERRQELERKIREARRELDEAIFADKFNERTIRKKAESIAALEAERITMRAKAFAKLRPSLTPEQMERIKRRHAHVLFDAGAPLPLPRFRAREDRFRELADGRPGERFHEEQSFRSQARPEYPRDPRAETRWHDRRPPPERRFGEPERPDGERRHPFRE